MDATETIHITEQAMTLAMMLAAPSLIAALIIGLIVSLLQALTQIQEPTLSFVPKAVAVFAVLSFGAPYMLAQLIGFTQELADHVVGMG